MKKIFYIFNNIDYKIFHNESKGKSIYFEFYIQDNTNEFHGFNVSNMILYYNIKLRIDFNQFLRNCMSLLIRFPNVNSQ